MAVMANFTFSHNQLSLVVSLDLAIYTGRLLQKDMNFLEEKHMTDQRTDQQTKPLIELLFKENQRIIRHRLCARRLLIFRLWSSRLWASTYYSSNPLDASLFERTRLKLVEI